MDYVNLGNTGTKVSRLCLGCMSYGDKSWRQWILTEDESLPFFRQAWEGGINFYDTADVYSLGASEEVTGRALLKTLGIPRDQLVIATKAFSPMGDGPNDRGLSAKHIRHAIDASLQRLGTDYIDLYQIHRFDRTTPVEETLEALDLAVKQGKVLHIGASSMFAWQLAKMLTASDRRGLSRFVTMQNHYNLAYREEEREVNPLCLDQGIGLLPWSPLARGFLTGNRRRDEKKGEGRTERERTDEFAHGLYYTDADYDVVDRVTEVAGKRGIPNAQVALAWLLRQPGVTAPIIGATKPHHLADALAALDVRLDEGELKSLAEPYKPHPILGHS